jgi:hypothetical protein
MHRFKLQNMSLRVIREILESEDLMESANLITRPTKLFSLTTFCSKVLEWCLQILLMMLQDSNCFAH